MRSLLLERWGAFIRYYPLEAGSDPIIYLAGLSFPSMLAFLAVATHRDLADRGALLVDNIGAGLSDHPAEFGYSMGEHADTVAAILDAEELSGCTVVGHSMGGTVAIELAARRPELVANLIVGEANLTPGGGPATRHITSFSPQRWVERQYDEERELWRRAALEGDPESAYMLDAWGSSDPAGLHANATALVGLDQSFKQRFFDLAMPRTFIYGEHNYPHRPQDATADAPAPDELRAQGISVGVVPDAGHLLMVDNLDGFVDAVTHALA